MFLSHVVLAISFSLTMAPPTGPKNVKSELRPAKFDKQLADLPYGESLEPLMAHLGALVSKSFDARYRETATNPHARDKLQEEIRIRIQAIRDSYVEFKGQKTGYTVSVVANEFAHNAGEAMLVMPRKKHKCYFFMSKSAGGFWKVVTAKVSKQPFSEYLVKLVAEYGKPAEITYSDPESKSGPTRALWRDAKYVVEARARVDYSAITLSWSLRSAADNIAQYRKGKKPAGAASDGDLDPSILDILK